VASIDLYRFCNAVIVLSGTVLVLVIEISLFWLCLRSTHDQAKLLPLSANEHETWHESQSFWLPFFLNSQLRTRFRSSLTIVVENAKRPLTANLAGEVLSGPLRRLLHVANLLQKCFDIRSPRIGIRMHRSHDRLS